MCEVKLYPLLADVFLNLFVSAQFNQYLCCATPFETSWMLSCIFPL